MKTIAATSVVLGTSFLLWGTASDRMGSPSASEVAEAHLVASATNLDDDDLNGVIEASCVRCHSERRMTGNLSLEGFDVANAAEQAEVAERIIRKLRAGMMPPPGARKPAGDTLEVLVETIEREVDEVWENDPRPGTRPFQRLNQPEYERAIWALLGLRVDASQWLPADQISASFDNIADVQGLSPLLLESYLNAAADIARMAVGDRDATTVEHTYENSQYLSQHPWQRVEGAPYGTRGGIVVEHTFPADGEYYFQASFTSGDNAPFEDLDISIDGERVALMAFTSIGRGADGRGALPQRSEPVFVRAGQHKVSAAFIRRTEGPYEDLMRPHDWSLAGGGAGGGGVTTLPHLRGITIGGPIRVTGVSETPSRARIFTCRPVSSAEEGPCAREIVQRLATQAYRRPVTEDEIQSLMWFYEEGRASGGFELGVRTALEAILSSPFFTLRLERAPSGVEAGEIYELADLDLANRLSFFLWGLPPDDELLRVAAAGDLDGDELERQARRMLADPRADALATRFAAQWLRLQDLYKVRPDPNFYPNFDENLADLMHRETEMFFNYLVDENRDVLELFTADYSFMNQRLAGHYGISGVAGDAFRRVDYPADMPRSGILGHGSVLVLTSLANRTSPVLRGKWVMEVLLGTPPPPPPPNVPTLEESSDDTAEGGRSLTTRERMEQHRANPTCNSCHSLIDPIGLALDNFDVTGKWRVRESGTELDTRGEFYDGTLIASPADLAAAIMSRPLPLVRTFTEHLMAYAIGRRMEYFDGPAVRQVVRQAEEDGRYPVASIILEVIKSDAFRLKEASAVTAEAGQ